MPQEQEKTTADSLLEGRIDRTSPILIDAMENSQLKILGSQQDEELADSTNGKVQESAQDITEETNKTTAAKNRSEKREHARYILFGTCFSVCLLILVLFFNEQANAYAIVALNWVRPRIFFEEDRAATYQRLQYAASQARWKQQFQKEVILREAAVVEAKRLGDREDLLIESLLRSARCQAGLFSNEDSARRRSELVTDEALFQNKLPEIINRLTQYKFAVEKRVNKALPIALKTHGPRHKDVVEAYKILGQTSLSFSKCLKDSKDVRQAAKVSSMATIYFQKALWSAERCFGPYSSESRGIRSFLYPNHPSSVWSEPTSPNKQTECSIDLLKDATYLEDRHQFGEAEKIYIKAVTESQRQLGKHPYTALCSNAYACFLHGRNRLEEAVIYEKIADDIWDKERKHPTWKWKFYYNRLE